MDYPGEHEKRGERPGVPVVCPLYKAPARDNELLMSLLHPRSLAAFAALFALVACGISTPEAGRPALDDSASAPGMSTSTAPPAKLVLSQDACQSDGDCVPATCCHAAACMSKENAKPCDVMCTQVCQPGTIDCGGGCLCHEGRCAARLMSVVFR